MAVRSSLFSPSALCTTSSILSLRATPSPYWDIPLRVRVLYI